MREEKIYLRSGRWDLPKSAAGRPVLITGGAGFIGTNLAHRLLLSGKRVLIFDNFSRPGVIRNAEWLRRVHGDRLEIRAADVRNRPALRQAVRRASQVFHFAAQVAVTTSLVQPIHDFEVNLVGTLNLLEELRSIQNPPPLVFTSTNKIYGALEEVKLRRNGTRYLPRSGSAAVQGIGENRRLDFHSPYGCSKGAADQYVIDYARTYGIPALVFRMSCIYGLHQFGTEDQGWVAHFLIQSGRNQPITLFGDGMQVRDVLFAEDLIDAFILAQEHMDTLSGQAFNVGGGPDNTISLIELLDLIADLRGKRPETLHEAWRPGDQRYYVSDISKFRNATGWSPRVSVSEGVKRLIRWLEGESGMMEHESNRTSYLDREAVRPPSPVAYSAARRDAP